jgi:hypothetical protein
MTLDKCSLFRLSGGMPILHSGSHFRQLHGQLLYARHYTENLKQIFLEKELCGLSPNFHIYVSVSDLYIPTIGLPFLLHTVIRFV